MALRDAGMKDNEPDGTKDVEPGSENGRSKTKAGRKGSQPRRKAPPPVANEKADLGTALRDVYQEAVKEAIPDEMLDLLKRLS